MFAYFKLQAVTATATAWHNILQCVVFSPSKIETFVVLIKDAEIEILATNKKNHWRVRD